MKETILKESIGYIGTNSSFHKNIYYSNIVKEFGRAIREKGLDKAFQDEYVFQESSYDEERFRVVNHLANFPNLTVALSKNSFPILFEGYVIPEIHVKEYELNEGVLDLIKKIVDWIGTKFAAVFLRNTKRKELVQKVADGLKENPNELPNKISEAMRNNPNIPHTSIQNIKPAVEAGKQQTNGNLQASHDYVNSIPKPVLKEGSLEELESLIFEASPIFDWWRSAGDFRLRSAHAYINVD